MLIFMIVLISIWGLCALGILGTCIASLIYRYKHIMYYYEDGEWHKYPTYYDFSDKD